MALPMALIIIAGEIDLSVESMAGLSCAVVGVLWQAGVPIQVAIPIVLVIGAAGGLLNGVLVTRRAAVARRHARDAGAVPRPGPRGPRAAGRRRVPDWFTSFGFGTVPGTPIPWPLFIFAGLAVVLGMVLHTTWLGRRIFAIGKNASAARYSGVGVARIKLVLFVFNGVDRRARRRHPHARFASARADIGQGLTLTVVTIVLLGGVNIFGGRGNDPRRRPRSRDTRRPGNVLRLTNVSAEIQSIAVGLLLIVSVVIPNLARQVTHGMGRVHEAGRPPPTAGAGEDSQFMRQEEAQVEVTQSRRIAALSFAVMRSRACSAAARRPPPPRRAPASAAPGPRPPSRQRLRPRRRRQRRSQRRLHPEGINNPYFDAAATGARRRPPSWAASSSRSARTRPGRADPVHPGRHDPGRQGDRRLGRRPDEVAPALKAAKEAGIKVVGYDSSPADGAYNVFVNQTDFSLIGGDMAQWACDLAPSCTGEIAILSATATATNQNAWIAAHEEDPATDPKYARASSSSTPSTATTTPTKSTTLAQACCSHHPNLKVIVAPTTVGILAAAQVVKQAASAVKVTGLGLPNDMKSFVTDGTSPEFGLWSVPDLGYLAYYVAAKLVNGAIKGTPGETFTVPSLNGGKPYTIGEDSVVILGPPFVFNKDQHRQLQLLDRLPPSARPREHRSRGLVLSEDCDGTNRVRDAPPARRGGRVPAAPRGRLAGDAGRARPPGARELLDLPRRRGPVRLPRGRRLRGVPGDDGGLSEANARWHDPARRRADPDRGPGPVACPRHRGRRRGASAFPDLERG